MVEGFFFGKEEVVVEVPFPPSINGYWRSFVQGKRVRQIISKRGREYRKRGCEICLLQSACVGLSGRLSVRITLRPPTKRKYDIDNYIKAIFDMLTHAGVWEDDEQVDSLLVVRGEVIKGGSAIVEIFKKGDDK